MKQVTITCLSEQTEKLAELFASIINALDGGQILYEANKECKDARLLVAALELMKLKLR